MIFECNCLTCRKQSLNNSSLYWKKINKSEYFRFYKNNKINWKKHHGMLTEDLILVMK